jgi:hypothetical protein
MKCVRCGDKHYLAGNEMRLLPVAAQMVGVPKMNTADVTLALIGCSHGPHSMHVCHVVVQLRLVGEPGNKRSL